MSDLAIIVDKKDRVLAHKDRHQLMPGDIIRISTLWIENSNGDVLLAQRSFSKKHDPGLWGPAAAGTLEPGETYNSNIYKEAEEEIGITGRKFTKVLKTYFIREDGTGRYVTFYKVITDVPEDGFKIQKDEVEKVAWFDKKELYEDLTLNPQKYVPSAQLWTRVFPIVL